MPYAKVKELPDALQQALAAVGYGRSDILIEAKETESLFIAGGDGYRGFVCLVDLGTGSRQLHRGSWGGSNILNPQNHVDLDDRNYLLPPNGAVIKGSEGGNRPVLATISLHPSNIVRFLPAAPSLSNDEQRVLYAYKSLKAGPYRQDAMRGIPSTVADELVEKGMLKRSKNGATQITSDGKNALEQSGYKGRF